MSAQFSDLAQKTILITGATRGIGRELARFLASQKAWVVFNYRGDEQRSRELQDELLTLGASKATGLKFDVTDKEAIDQAIKEFTKEHGPIHGLVNNAGISKDQLVLRLKKEEIDQTIDINLKGALYVSQSLSRNFLRAPGASVVNVSSVVGLMGNTGQMAYAASKAGMIGLTKSYAKELSSKGVRCNAICPGFIETEMTQSLADSTKEKYLAEIALGRLGQTKEIAQLVAFLLSDASSYITGEVIKIDGGLYI